jgi:hypothetical protein
MADRWGGVSDRADGETASDPPGYRFVELDSACFIPHAPTGRNSTLLDTAELWFNGRPVALKPPDGPDV